MARGKGEGGATPRELRAREEPRQRWRPATVSQRQRRRQRRRAGAVAELMGVAEEEEVGGGGELQWRYNAYADQDGSPQRPEQSPRLREAEPGEAPPATAASSCSI